MTASNGAGEGHGASVRRVEDPPFLRGTRPYTDDLREPGALYAVFVRSGFAHATINEHRQATRRWPCRASSASTRRTTSNLEAVRHRRPAGRHAGGDAPPGAGHRQGALHRRAGRGRWSPRRARRPSTPPSSSTSTTTRSTSLVDMTKALDADAPKLFEMRQPRRGRARRARTRSPTPRCASARASSTSASPPCRWSRAPRWPSPTRTTRRLHPLHAQPGPARLPGRDLRRRPASRPTSCASSRPRPAAASAPASRATRSRSSSSRWPASSARPSATSRRARRRCSRCSTGARRCRTSRSAAPATARSPA